MAEPDHDVFDLLIERGDAGYRARVLNSPAGNAAANLGPSISEQQLESFLFKVGRPRRTARRGGLSIGNEVRTLGEQLFEFLFPPTLRACLQSSLIAARMRGSGLRIQIRLSDVPELADLPWELLYERDASHFSLSTQTPVVRFLEMRQPLASLTVMPPLRVLVVISSPIDYPRLDVEREWAKLTEATAGAASKGLLMLDRLETARLARLNRHLRSAEYHILHYIGHGDFDEDEGTGELHFEDERGRAARVAANQLAAALRDHRSLRLVVLNACEGARASRKDPFAGTAQTLIANGIPAVVAMQFEITDEAAITFASEFYSSLAVGDPVDQALSEARKGIFFDGNPLEWATPVLYLRAATGRIFDIVKSNAAERLRAEQMAAREAHQRNAAVDRTEVAEREAEEKAQREEEEKARREAAQRKEEEKARREAAQRGKPNAPKWQERKKLIAGSAGVLAILLLGITGVGTWRLVMPHQEAAQRASEERARQEAAQRAAGEKARQEAAQRASEERARQEAAQRASEEKARQEAAQRASEERARQEAAQRASEERARQEAAQRASEERARQEAAQREEEEKARREAAQRASEEKARQEAAQRAAGEKARQEAAQRASEERARQEAAQRAAEEKARQEAGWRMLADTVLVTREVTRAGDPSEYTGIWAFEIGGGTVSATYRDSLRNTSWSLKAQAKDLRSVTESDVKNIEGKRRVVTVSCSSQRAQCVSRRESSGAEDTSGYMELYLQPTTDIGNFVRAFQTIIASP